MRVTIASTIFSRLLHIAAFGAVLIASQAQAAPALNAECVLAPSRNVEIASSVAGRLERVLVERSQPVKAGDVIARLESSVERAELAVAQARADLSAEASLAKARLRYDERNAKRLASLHAVSAATEFERDRASRDAQISSWRVERATELQNLQQLELARTRTQLETRTVRSPVDGFVLRRHRSAGEFVDDQPIVTVVSLDPLHVEAVVGLELLGRISKGMRAMVSLEASLSAPRVAEVTVVDRVVDAASATFGVRLTLPNPSFEIPAGLKCRVRFLTQREAGADDGLEVPLAHAEAAQAEADDAKADENHWVEHSDVEDSHVEHSHVEDNQAADNQASDNRTENDKARDNWAEANRVRAGAFQATGRQPLTASVAPCTRIGPIAEEDMALRAKRRLAPLTGIPLLEQDNAKAWWLMLPVPADTEEVRAALGGSLATLASQCRSAPPDAFTVDAGGNR